jgi:hypothetical protein
MTQHRECIGGPFDGQTMPFERRMVVVGLYHGGASTRVSWNVDDEPDGMMESSAGRYVRFPKDARPGEARFPKDARPGEARWIEY